MKYAATENRKWTEMRIALFSADTAIEDLLNRTLTGSGFEVSRFDANEVLASGEQQPEVILACLASRELADSQPDYKAQQSLAQLSTLLQQAGQALFVGERGEVAASKEGPRLTRKQWGAIELVAAGKSDHQIASAWGITPRAVRALINRVFERVSPGQTLSNREQVIEAQRVLASRPR
jgi:DNA-binding NarL/FixJ family response regulator